MKTKLTAGAKVRRRLNRGFAFASPGHNRKQHRPEYVLTGETRRGPGGLQWECQRGRLIEWIAQSRLEVVNDPS